jgi:hypothetical protein
MLLLSIGRLQAATWSGQSGAWNDATRWSPSLDHTATANLDNGADVEFANGEALVNRVEVATNRPGNAKLTVSGGALFGGEMVRAGEVTGAHGRIIQTGGLIVTNGVYIGGANPGHGTDRACTGELELRGGRLVTRHLAFGWAGDSTARLRIVGSQLEPPVALDYLWLGHREKSVPGSKVEFRFVLDAGGVAPIVVWNRKQAVALIEKTSLGACRLAVELSAPPPGGEIPLLRLALPCRGTFTDLPQDAPVAAEFGGRKYRWKISYRGGATASDVVLTQPEILSADGAWQPYTSATPARVFTVDEASILAAMRRLYTAAQAHEAPLDATAGLAFEGAEGYGRYARGGRDGTTIEVTTLNDSGPGSLRAAIESKGPRKIVFRVGGVIVVKTPLVIREPFLTLDGSQAPGEGVCLQGASTLRGDVLCLSGTHDVIIRYLRVQHGRGSETLGLDDGGDCLSAYDSQNFIVDHCSLLWGTDEVISCTGSVDRYTVQWCIIAEGLNHTKHSMASLLGGGRCTWHHNVLAHNGSRNPNIVGQPRCDFRHNTLYNWGHTSGQGSFLELNYVANYLRPGPSTVQTPPRFLSGETALLPGSLHLAGNVIAGTPESTSDNWMAVGYARSCEQATQFDHGPFPPETAERAHARVLEKAGALLPRRDAADRRILRDVADGTGAIISSQDEVGGFPTYQP